jgi:hypothetical protein
MTHRNRDLRHEHRTHESSLFSRGKPGTSLYSTYLLDLGSYTVERCILIILPHISALERPRVDNSKPVPVEMQTTLFMTSYQPVMSCNQFAQSTAG